MRLPARAPTRGAWGCVTSMAPEGSWNSITAMRRLLFLLRGFLHEEERERGDHQGDPRADPEQLALPVPLHDLPEEEDAQDRDHHADQLRLEIVEIVDLEPPGQAQRHVDEERVEPEAADQHCHA